jgi:hypothetical protein
MKHNSFAFSVALAGVVALVGSVRGLNAAEVSGKVKLSGTPPPEKTVVEAEAICGSFLTHKPLKTRHYVVGADNGLGNVFVYVKEGAQPTPPKREPPLLDQVNCEYVPYMMGVQVNQKFKIKNSDPTLHNVHATPKINKEFNFAQPVKGQVDERSFDKPEVLVRMKCDVHPWMFAYIGVMEHPYFAVTDKDGNYKIEGLPAGKYTIEAVHMKAGRKTAELTVAEADKKTLDLELSVPAQ